MKPAIGLWLSSALMVAAQMVQPSNNSADLADPSTSPRFYLNATGSVKFPGIVLAPLGQYAYISRNTFLNIKFDGLLVNTDANNANQVQSYDLNFVPCDPEEYEGGNLDVNTVLRIIANQPGNGDNKSSLIFYSTRSNHCNATGISNLPIINGIFTTIDPVAAAEIASRNFTESSNATGTVIPDQGTFTNYGGGGGAFNQPTTTAIAMIILYAVTGIITALFVVIIVTGAIRAHRHPERYGPRNSTGAPRQSRAKGIARAMLETLPIVKFGDHHDLPTTKPNATRDVEMAQSPSSAAADPAKDGDKSVTTTTTAEINPAAEASSSTHTDNAEGVKDINGNDDADNLGCSICTEDFQKGEEVRVLPCNHKFHPECVDPWLLNVSGTCPLCRINLSTQSDEGTDSNTSPPINSPSPFTDRRSQAIHQLMAMAYGSRDERVNALRQYRTDRRNRSTGQMNEEERISRARRFREALRIRTRRHEPNETEREMRDSGIDAISGTGGQMRL